MEQILMPAELDRDAAEERLVHDWRTEQLRRVGLPHSLAETFADIVDWHALEDLVGRGCAPRLALEIVR
jgi:hypothetical protein